MSKSYILKVGIVGKYSIGKTSFLNSYIEQESVISQLSTIGVDFRSQIYEYNNTSFKLHIWDTAGQEQFSSIVKSYLRQLDVVILMYDITDNRTFKEINKWIDEIDFLNKDKKVIKYIVGNKKDLENYRQVNFREAQKFAKKNNINISETSMKDLNSINYVFEKVIEETYSKLINNEIILKEFHNLIIEKETNEDEKNKCCIIL